MAGMAEITRTTDTPPKRDDRAMVIANSLHRVRRRRGMTLADLASATTLDKGYLSRLERGQKTPTIGTLMRIATALDVSVGHLCGETTSDESITVVRGDAHVDISPAGGAGAALAAILPASGSRRLSAFIVEAGVQGEESSADHPGDEIIYVLEGTITIEFPDRSVELNAGDLVHFDGHLRHSLHAKEGATARALVVIGQDLDLRAAG